MEQRSSLKNIGNMLQDPGFDRVLVACHRSPDGDAVGSSHALAAALRKMGKQARVFCPDPIGEEFSYLTEAEQGLSFFEPEHFVTVDIASPEMLCSAPFLSKIEIVLDHPRINTVEGKVKYIDPEKASCAEIVLELLDVMGVELDSYLAKALYTAIATDTGCFRYSNTTKDTFLAAAKLSAYVRKGDFYAINKLMFETKSLLKLKLEGYAVSHMKTAFDGKVAYLLVTLKEREKLGATYADMDGLIAVVRQLAGVKVAMVIREREEGEFKVSVRSEGDFDASQFCSAFGGGGHIAAAGCTLFGKQEEDIVPRLLEEAERRLS